MFLRRRNADLVNRIGRAGAHHAHAHAFLQFAVYNPHKDDNAKIRVIPAVDEERLQWRVRVARRGGKLGDNRFEHVRHAHAGLGGNLDRFRGVNADDVLDLRLDAVGLGGGQVDFVEDRHDFEIDVDRLIDIGERLRLDALARVDDEERALARRQRTRHLISEVHMARRVDEIEDIGLAVARRVFEPDGLRLDGDPALALKLMESSTCSFISRSVSPPVTWISRSASVDLP